LLIHFASFGQESNLIKGLYLSFPEFLENSPRGTDQFYEEETNRAGTAWEGTQSITLRLNKTDRKISNVWGYSDGAHQFIQHQDDYFIIEIRNDSFLFDGYELVKKDDWYTGEYQNPSDAKRAKKNALEQAKLKKHHFYIDKETGDAIRIIKGQNEMKSNAMELVIYRLGKKQMDTTFEITINDANATSCSPNSVYSYLISPESNGATVCLQDQDICLDIPFNTNEPQYVEVSRLISDSHATLKHVKKEKGEWDAQEIQSEMKKKTEK